MNRIRDADLYETRRQTANDEAKRLNDDEVKPRNSTNWKAARYSPGGDANHIVKNERNQRNNILKKLNKANKTINENPTKIDDATDELNTLKAALDAIPSEEEAVEIAIANANGAIQKAYTAVEDLTPAKEAWEQYKQDNNWDNLTLEEKLDLQEAYGGDWVALRGDGSPAKQEQELALFSQKIENFEADVEQDRQAEIAQANQEINTQQDRIDKLQKKLDDARDDLPGLEGQLANFYETNDLRDRLEQVKADSESELAALESDNSLTEAQKEERRDFYESDIDRTQALLEKIDDEDRQASLDSLFDKADKYFKNTLKADAKNSDRLIFNEDGSPAVYTQEDLTVRVPVYDEDGNIINYTTSTFDTVAVGDQKTVGSEYQRRQAEAQAFNQARKQRETARNNAKKDRNSELAAKQEDLNNRNQAWNLKQDALADQQEQIKLKDQLLLEIETTIAQVRDEAIAAEKREQMKESLAAAEVENQREQELEDRYGIRTLDNPGGVPNSPEEVLIASVPEPSSVFGLAAVIGGLVSFRRRFGR